MRYAVALARHGHFGRAAEACGVSQPALSVQIRELEAGLGAALFERGPGPVRPTGLGELYTERAAAILRATDDLADLARGARSELTGRLRLGVIPTVAPYLLPRLLPVLAAQRPGLHLEMRETLTARLLQELRAGGLDAAILALPLPGGHGDLSAATLLREPLVLVRPAAEAGAPVPAPDALPAERLLLLEDGHCFRDHALAACDRPTGPGSGGSLGGATLATLVQLVAAGMGITLIPRMAIEVETRGGAVAVDHFASPAPARTLAMVWRSASPLATHLAGLAHVAASAADPAGATP